MAKQYVNRDNPGLKRRILIVTVHRDVNDNPDLSYLGEYSQTPAGDYTIDRQERGDMLRGEYRYFTAGNSPEETGNPDSAEQDYKRYEAYNNQQWCMVGTYVTAEVQLGGMVCQTIRSGGLWGTESDSEESYFEEIVAEELNNLRWELLAMGFTNRQITLAFKERQRAE